MGNGSKISFWDDIWLGQIPLRLEFPRILAACEQKEIRVADVIAPHGLHLSFCRSFGPREIEQWGELKIKVAGVSLRSEDDVGFWSLYKNSHYSSKSLYREILHPGFLDLRMRDMWKTYMPSKVKIFAWMCCRGRIQVMA